MTIAEKGFFLSYIDDPLSKTAGPLGNLGPAIFDYGAAEVKKQRGEDMISRGAAGGVAGILAGGGISALWGKLHDKPSVRRDLIAGLLGGVGGAAGGIFSAVVGAERDLRKIRGQRELYGGWSADY